jgi:IS1 family transposase
MNVITRAEQVAVLAALVDGNSERAVERMTGVNRATVSRYGLLFGQGAQAIHNRLVRDLSCSRVQVDEIWSYVTKKQFRVTETDPPEFGEAYTYVALDTASRLVISFHVGRRNDENTRIFINDMRRRLLVVPAMTSDGFIPYVSAIGGNFGGSIDYGQVVKNYKYKPKDKKKGAYKGRRNRDDDHRYEPARGPGFITKKPIFGAPDLDTSSTAYVERNNGTMRHKIGRMRRLAYAFSKRIDNHKAAIATNYVHYNLCHVVKTLRVTPAMAAGITDHVWDIEEFFDALVTAPPCDVPEMHPLAHREPATAHRELPGGRGFLRVVKDRGAPKQQVPPTVQVSRVQPVQLGLFEDKPEKT